MNDEHFPPASPSNAPLPRLGDAPTFAAAAPVTVTKRTEEIGQHLKLAFVYLGIIFMVCASAAFVGENALILAVYAYWGALGMHALLALYLMVRSALSGNWAAFGRHVVAVLLVAAIAAGACWLNLMASSMGGSLF